MFISKSKLFFWAVDLSRPRSWRDDAYNLAEFELWDGGWKKRLGWRAGLKYFRQTNCKRAWVLASRHWPHLLCWDWSLWLRLRDKSRGEGIASGVSISRKYRRASLQLLGSSLDLTWQDYGHMANVGPVSNGAPKILWNHHLAAAEVAGSA